MHRLSSREKEIVKLIAKNKSSNKIAALLNVTTKTIYKHRENICKKLGLTGRNSLLHHAMGMDYSLEDETNQLEIFPWNDDFHVGIPLIDEQHKILVQLVNKLARHFANDNISQLESISEELATYTDYHFKSEEKIWLQYFKDDPYYTDHKHAHNSFLPKIIEFKVDESSATTNKSVEDLLKFLINWLAFHILDSDRRYAIIIDKIDSGHTLEEAKGISDQIMNDSVKVLIATVLSMYDQLFSRTINLMKEHIERKRLEDQLRVVNEDLETKVKEEIAKRTEHEHLLVQQSKMAAMGEMLSAIAHQWRQPLNSVGLNVQETEDTYDDGELDKEYISEFVRNTMEQIEYMSGTIDDFRNFFKPSKEEAVFPVNKILKETVRLLDSQMKHHYMDVSLSESTEELFAKGYPEELKQVLLNIINNAKDAILDKNIEGGKIKIAESFADGKITIAVHDNGIGIPKNILNNIFNPYFTTKEEGKGTGIGLYMAKMIIEDHMYGRIYGESSDNGTTFFIELPREEQEALQ